MDAVEEHRRHIDRWFYDRSTGVPRGLAEICLADARFTEHYERREPGLAQYLADAIHTNADRQERRAGA